MISDYENYYAGDPPSTSWEKVTRRIVDPITFSCRANVTFVPRIEDCSYETTNIAIGHPRFGEKPRPETATTTATTTTTNGNTFASPINNTSGRKPKIGSSNPILTNNNVNINNNNDAAWTPHDFSSTTKSPIKSLKSPVKSSAKSPSSSKQQATRIPVKQSKNMVKPTKSGGDNPKVASLGAFFSKASVANVQEMDNQSLSSRSMNSRSVSELSNAERSKAEDKLKSRRAKNKMLSIDEQSVSEFPEKKESSASSSSSPNKGGTLGSFLNDKTMASPMKVEDDNRSIMSSGSKVSLMSTADRSKYEKKLRSARASKPNHEQKIKRDVQEEPAVVKRQKEKKPSSSMPLKSILKKGGSSGSSAKKGRKLEIKDGHDMMEMPTLDDKDYYRDWDDIWYGEEELADMRYEAFLEEAGLDVDEYMNM